MDDDEILHREGQRRRIVDLAVAAADEVLLRECDGGSVELLYFTTEVARRFVEKSSMMVLAEVHKEELLDDVLDRELR